MFTHANKTQQNKTRSVANKVAQKKNRGTSSFQFVDNRPEAVAQRKLQEMANNSPQAKQAAQFQAIANNHPAQQQQSSQKKVSPEPGGRKNNTGLPDNLKSGIENLSGYSMDDVKVHYNSDKPAQLQAHAYAQGTDIHLASGQEKHLPHEAWHIVQQKQGRVKPTMQMKGNVNINDDAGLEKEADVMGKKAFQFVDNRPEAIAQRKLQEIANNNPRAKQANQLQSVIQKNGNDPLSEGSLRPALGKKLWENLGGPNWFAKGVFKAMNLAMYVEGQKLTPEHNAVLEKYLIENKKGVLDTLVAENPYVMKSSGFTPVYLMGKYLVHKPIEKVLKMTPEEIRDFHQQARNDVISGHS